MNDVFLHIRPEQREQRPASLTFPIHIYDATTKQGIHAKPLPKEDIETLDAQAEIDWIVPIPPHAYVRHVEIGNYVLCEVQPDFLEAVKTAQQNVFLYTGQAWIWLIHRQVYTMETDKRRQVWIGELCTFQDVLDNTCLPVTMTQEGITHFLEREESIESVRIAKARCEPSMYFLDDIHRKYVYDHRFDKGDVVAVQSVAGSGKTTTLLTLAKRHTNKRILYIAFNKSLVTEIKQKIYTQKIPNLYPMTFDSLLYNMYSQVKKEDPTIITLRPQNVHNYVAWLKGKHYKLKDSIVRQFNKFCNDPRFTEIDEYCMYEFGKRKPILEELWAKSKQGAFHTFETMRKRAQTEHWFDPYIDKTYDMIMVDETQDFDMNMLRMLLDDTKSPKLFVGDPKQSIYEFRGCINAFLHMPDDALRIEFYSTFRVGNPACEIIRKQFSDCWMVSKSTHETILEPYSKWLGTSYTYIFRSWKCLLTAAATMEKIWIHSFDKKAEEIRKLHAKLAFTFSLEEEFEDDLPKFLKSITSYELDNLLETIEQHQADKEEALVKMYTVHAYKGLEDDVVRLADDIDRAEETIYYVALTRGRTRILTPNDIEYFEKIFSPKPVETKPIPIAPILLANKPKQCTCSGCANKDHMVAFFETKMGSKRWCIDCSIHPCECFG